MILVRGHSHELCFWKQKCFNVFCARSQGANHGTLLLVIKDDVKTWLILVHRVEYNLKEQRDVEYHLSQPSA